ncbi:uncharacterized protein LOC125216725 [Salvia hispanica]|uniref:uncharacterized protein LOC125216725 n=1 Tax=Salvia hispanica TaxID=49212 RepID=UPI0020096B6C|nr:uncharacterized protein LOC125216725 [Salvia hispanica]
MGLKEKEKEKFETSSFLTTTTTIGQFGKPILNLSTRIANMRANSTFSPYECIMFHKEEYLGGEVRFIDSCNVKRFKLNELSLIMVALGCGSKYVCEFYYALPENSFKCEGWQVRHPLRPLVDEVHFEGFISLLPSVLRDVHVCVKRSSCVLYRADKD